MLRGSCFYSFLLLFRLLLLIPFTLPPAPTSSFYSPSCFNSFISLSFLLLLLPFPVTLNLFLLLHISLSHVPHPSPLITGAVHHGMRPHVSQPPLCQPGLYTQGTAQVVVAAAPGKHCKALLLAPYSPCSLLLTPWPSFSLLPAPCSLLLQ